MSPKIKSKSNVRIEGNIEHESCSTTWVDPIKVIEPYPNPKNSPLGLQKVKNEQKIDSKSNARIEGNIENESCLSTWVDVKTVVDPYSDPKTSRLGPQQHKNEPQNQIIFKCQNSGNHRKWKLFSYMSLPQNTFWTQDWTQKWLIRAPKGFSKNCKTKSTQMSELKETKTSWAELGQAQKRLNWIW